MPNQQQFEVVASISAQSGGSITGGTVDLQDTINAGGRNIKAFINVTNTGADPDEVLDVKVQHAADDGTGSPDTWSDVTGATFTQLDVSADGAEQDIHFVTNNRFVRLVSTGAGTTPVFSQYGGFLLEKRLT